MGLTLNESTLSDTVNRGIQPEREAKTKVATVDVRLEKRSGESLSARVNMGRVIEWKILIICHQDAVTDSVE